MALQEVGSMAVHLDSSEDEGCGSATGPGHELDIKQSDHPLWTSHEC